MFIRLDIIGSIRTAVGYWGVEFTRKYHDSRPVVAMATSRNWSAL